RGASRIRATRRRRTSAERRAQPSRLSMSPRSVTSILYCGSSCGAPAGRAKNTMMSSWQDAVRDKLTSPAQAVSRVKSGDLVRLQMGPVPVTLVNALAQRRDELRGVRVLQGATRHPQPWATSEAGWEEHIQYLSDFVSVLVRPSVAARRADFAIT